MRLLIRRIRMFLPLNGFLIFDPRHELFQKYCYSSAKFRVGRVEFDRERRDAGQLGLIRRAVIWLAEKSRGSMSTRSHICIR